MDVAIYTFSSFFGACAGLSFDLALIQSESNLDSTFNELGHHALTQRIPQRQHPAPQSTDFNTYDPYAHHRHRRYHRHHQLHRTAKSAGHGASDL